jgi:pimeloyl-ACP methyl ester carboxylesterase
MLGATTAFGPDMPSPRQIIDAPQIGDRYFFPMKARVPDPVYVLIDAGRLSCWRSDPDENRPVLVHFHGNGEVVTDWIDSPLVTAIRNAGWEVFLAEYRGYAESDGQPRLESMLDDSPAILKAVNRDPKDIVVFGRSVGSIFAIDWVRRYPTTAGLVLESGIHDVHERLALRVSAAELGLERQEFKDVVDQRFDHNDVLTSYPGPTLVLHAEHDHLVDISHGERNANAAQKAEFIRFPNGDHNSILAANQANYLAYLKRFLANARL